MSLLPGYHKIEGSVHTSKRQFVENSVVVSSSVSTRVRLGWGFWILRLFNVTAPSRFEVHRQFLGGRNHEGREYQPGAFSSRLSCVWVTAARHFAAIAHGIGDLGPVVISWFWWFTALFECIGSMLTSFEDGVSRHLGSPWYPFRSRVLRQNYERFQSTPGTHQQQVNLNVAMLARAKEPMEETRPKAQKVEHERNS